MNLQVLVVRQLDDEAKKLSQKHRAVSQRLTMIANVLALDYSLIDLPKAEVEVQRSQTATCGPCWIPNLTLKRKKYEKSVLNAGQGKIPEESTWTLPRSIENQPKAEGERTKSRASHLETA